MRGFRRARVALGMLALIGSVACGSLPTPTPLPGPPPGPCDPATMRCPKDVTPALHALGLTTVLPFNISDDGEVIGIAVEGLDASRGGSVGFRVSADGAAQLVRPPAGRRLHLWAVNSQGLIVGHAGMEHGPVVWDAQGTPTDLLPKLPTFGGSHAGGAATDVNEHGQVAGAYDLVFPAGEGETRRATVVFVWDARSDTVSVVNPGGTELMNDPLVPRVGIDERGVVVTSIQPAPGEPDALMRWVPRPDGTYRREVLGPHTFRAVSSHGDILTGESTVWAAGATAPVPLPPPPGWTPGVFFHFYAASDINAKGEIIGFSASSLGETRPLRWPAGATRRPELLQTDSRRMVQVVAIGDSGAIVGASPAGDPAKPGDIDITNQRVLVWEPAS